MKIVPTEVRTYANDLNTYQFSVTERVCSYSPTSMARTFLGLWKFVGDMGSLSL